MAKKNAVTMAAGPETAPEAAERAQETAEGLGVSRDPEAGESAREGAERPQETLEGLGVSQDPEAGENALGGAEGAEEMARPEAEEMACAGAQAPQGAQEGDSGSPPEPSAQARRAGAEVPLGCEAGPVGRGRARERPELSVEPEAERSGLCADDLAIVDAARGLNLRAGPGREFPVLAVLPDNSFVEVLELMGRYPDGCLYVTEVPGWALVCPFQLPGTPEEDRDGVFPGAPAGAQRSGSGGESRRKWSGADVWQSQTEQSGIFDGVGWVDRRFLAPVTGGAAE